MNNAQAIEALTEFTELAQRAVTTSVWATAFLLEGGEPTWDAVKDVANAARALKKQAIVVGNLDLRYQDITP